MKVKKNSAHLRNIFPHKILSGHSTFCGNGRESTRPSQPPYKRWKSKEQHYAWLNLTATCPTNRWQLRSDSYNRKQPIFATHGTCSHLDEIKGFTVRVRAVLLLIAPKISNGTYDNVPSASSSANGLNISVTCPGLKPPEKILQNYGNTRTITSERYKEKGLNLTGII